MKAKLSLLIRERLVGPKHLVFRLLAAKKERLEEVDFKLWTDRDMDPNRVSQFLFQSSFLIGLASVVKAPLA